jgi:hypothetical protein
MIKSVGSIVLANWLILTGLMQLASAAFIA